MNKITTEDVAKYSQEVMPEIVAVWDAANRIIARPYIKNNPLKKALEDLERKILELKQGRQCMIEQEGLPVDMEFKAVPELVDIPLRMPKVLSTLFEQLGESCGLTCDQMVSAVAILSLYQTGVIKIPSEPAPKPNLLVDGLQEDKCSEKNS